MNELTTAVVEQKPRLRGRLHQIAFFFSIPQGVAVVLELGLLEQRHKAVLKVLNGGTVADVACRSGVAHQMPSDVEARVGAIRREHPG